MLGSDEGYRRRKRVYGMAVRWTLGCDDGLSWLVLAGWCLRDFRFKRPWRICIEGFINVHMSLFDVAQVFDTRWGSGV